MKKIICTVINDLSHDQRMHRICSTLTNAGYAVILVGRKLPSSLKLPQQTFEQKRLKCFFVKGKLFYIEYNFRIFFFLLTQVFDMVCSVDLDTLTAGYCASAIKGKPCILDAHEYFQEVPEVVNRPITKKIWEIVAQLIIPRLKHCYTVSPGLAEIFTRKYGTSFATILNVPLTSASSQATKPDTFPVTENRILLYQGALNEGRGLEVAIGAMSGLEGVEFWLAGEGDLSDGLRDMVKKKGLSGKVKFLGFLSPEELRLLTPNAFLGYNLLENTGLSYYYSLANKFFDYIHARVPALNPAFPEYKTINMDYEVSILIDDLSPESVRKAIVLMMNDLNKYDQLKTNCERAALEFNWEKESKKLLEIYKNAGSRNKAKD